MLNKRLQNIAYFLLGLIAGGLGVFISAVFEGFAGLIWPELLHPNVSYPFILLLMLPALLEEGSKIFISKFSIGHYTNFWKILGIGLGFGIVESITRNVDYAIILLKPLPYAHVAFLLIGLFLARRITQKPSFCIWLWLLFSTVLHWGYDFLVIHY